MGANTTPIYTHSARSTELASIHGTQPVHHHHAVHHRRPDQQPGRGRPGAGRVQAMVSGIGFIAVSSRETMELRILVLIGFFVFAFSSSPGRCGSSLTLMLFASALMPADRAIPFT
jgi:hypothetical protein